MRSRNFACWFSPRRCEHCETTCNIIIDLSRIIFGVYRLSHCLFFVVRSISILLLLLCTMDCLVQLALFANNLRCIRGFALEQTYSIHVSFGCVFIFSITLSSHITVHILQCIHRQHCVSIWIFWFFVSFVVNTISH